MTTALPDGALEGVEALEAVVVAYDSGEALSHCIGSLDLAGVGRILIVDNGSQDGSVSRAKGEVPRAEVLVTERNLGFGGGVNRGMACCEADMVLVCNSDIVVDRDALAHLIETLRRDEEAAVVGPQLRAPDGSPSVSARRFPTLTRSYLQAFAGVLAPNGRAARRYRAANQALADRGEVDWVTGACLLVRRAAFQEVGGFDESFFMYVEEVDLCWRLKEAGWRVLHNRSVSVTHVGGVSSAGRPYAMVVAHHRSLWRFCRSTAKGPERLALPLVAVALVARAGLVLARQAARARLSGRAGPPPT